MPSWADLRLLADHLKTVHGFLGCIVRANDICVLWKIAAKYTWNGKATRTIRFYYPYVFVDCTLRRKDDSPKAVED
jgi:hypothetical protein